MEDTDSRPGTDRWSLVLCAGLAVFMAQLDTTVVSVALPDMRSDLRASTGAVEWVVLGYVVPLIGLSLLWGRWLDRANRRTTAAVSITGFAVCSLAVAAAPGLGAVVAARVLQGAFASALLALAPVVSVDAVAARSRGRALGIVSTLAPLGAMLGPTVGGRLVDLAGWRPIFLINLPVAAAVVLLGRRDLHDDRRLVEATRDVPVAELDDLIWADAYAFGTPTRYGNVASQLKQFLDTTGSIWAAGQLSDKAATGFTSAINTHGGNETTLMALYNTMCHWGAIIVPPGYTDSTIAPAGGNPYGTSHPSMNGAPGEHALAAAAYQGRRLARYAAAVLNAREPAA